MKSCFVCNTAFQIYSAGQYIKENQLKDAELVVASSVRGGKITLALLKSAPWKKIHFLLYDLGSPKAILKNVTAYTQRLSPIVSSASKIYLGSLYNLHNAIAVGLAPGRKIYAMDDGFETLAFLNGAPWKIQQQFRYILKRKWMTLLGIRVPTPIDIYRNLEGIVTWFPHCANNNAPKSVLPLPLSPLQTRASIPQCLFLGQPIYASPSNYLSVSYEEYVQWILHIQEHYQKLGYEFIYVVHPREPADKLSKFVKILRTDEIPELYLDRLEAHPKVLSGFFSMGLFSIHQLSRGSIQTMAWEIPKPHRREGWGTVDRIYQLLRSSGVEAKPLQLESSNVFVG